MSTLSLSVLIGERVLQLPPCAPSIDVATIKMLIEAETGIPAGSLVLLHAQRVVTDAQTLAALGVADHSMLECRSGASARPAMPAPAAAAGSRPAGASGAGAGRSTNRLGIPDAILSNPQASRDFIRQQPALLFQIESQNPPLHRALMSADLEPFAGMWKQITDNMEAEKREEAERFRLANLAAADPMNPELQARIEEEIRLKNVQENWEMAIEHNPEAFGRVVMLYVPMKVNGQPLQAFVDSGAQSTIMSVQCAERCGIMRLLDKRYAGIAKGVGSAKILGRVHQVPCVIGNAHISMSFTILENQNMSFLLGLDQLKNHQACIDLQKNALRIAGEEIPFLSEHAIQEGRDEEEEAGSAAAGSSAAAASSSSAAAAAGASASAKPAAASSAGAAQSQPSHLTTSGHNVTRPNAGVPSSQGSVATAAHRPAGALSASVPPPDFSPNPPAAANVAAVAAAQRRAAEANAAVAGATPTPASAPAAAAAAAAQPSIPPAVSVAAPPAAASRPAAVAAAGGPSESSIEQLVQLGFSRGESIQALAICNGNAELAAGYLFNQ